MDVRELQAGFQKSFEPSMGLLQLRRGKFGYVVYYISFVATDQRTSLHTLRQEAVKTSFLLSVMRELREGSISKWRPILFPARRALVKLDKSTLRT